MRSTTVRCAYCNADLSEEFEYWLELNWPDSEAWGRTLDRHIEAEHANRCVIVREHVLRKDAAIPTRYSPLASRSLNDEETRRAYSAAKEWYEVDFRDLDSCNLIVWVLPGVGKSTLAARILTAYIKRQAANKLE